MARQPLVGHGLLSIEASWSHSGTPHSVGLLYTARRRDLYLTKHNSRKKYPCPWQDYNPQFQKASSRRPTL
jgi:hypothetical protein